MTEPPVSPPTRRRQQVLDDALTQLRQTRAQLDPSLLARVRALIGDRTLQDLMAPAPDDRVPLPPGASPWNPAAPASTAPKPGYEVIDRRHNLQAIRLFLEIQQDNKVVQNRVRTLMAEYFN